MGLTRRFVLDSSDLGKGPVIFAWNPAGSMLAVACTKGRVLIVSREGKVVHQFPLTGVVAMDWDPVTETLAVITDRSSTVSLYHTQTVKVENFDAGVQDLCFLKWSGAESLLVIGSRKGAFVLYSRLTLRKVPIIGTHSDAIVDGAWSANNGRLFMVGADRVLSVSDTDGNVMYTAPLAAIPLSMCIVESKGRSGRCMAAVNLGAALQLVEVRTKDVVTAQFDSNLGTITGLECATDNMFLLGFSKGAVGMATLQGSELTLTSHVNAFRDAVKSVSFGHGSGLSAAIADNTLRLFRLGSEGVTELSGSSDSISNEFGQMGCVRWSPDGQCVAFSTLTGSIASYSSKVLNVSVTCGSLVFHFVSERVVGVRNIREGNIMCTVPVEMDPTFMDAGMGVLAVGSGNTVLYYEYYIPNSLPPGMDTFSSSQTGQRPPAEAYSKLLLSKKYPSTVTVVRVNSRFAAVLFDGQVEVHPLSATAEESSMRFPQGGEGAVMAIGISEPLFIYATTSKVCVYAIQNMQCVAEFACTTGLKRAFPNPMCTRVAYVDDNNALFVLNPITAVASSTEGFEADHREIVWDQADSTVFVSHDGTRMTTFVCTPHGRHGATCESILVQDNNTDNLYTPLPPNSQLVSLHRGLAVTQSSSGQLESVLLRSHIDIQSRVPNAQAFYNNFSLNRLRWATQNISTPQEAVHLAVKALHMLDIELAIRVYRQLSQPSLVLCLEKIKHIHEKNLLIGHVSMIIGYFKDAQTFFLRSSQPQCALEMRRDLMQWEPALALAKELDPEQVPIISAEYAQQLEYRGDYVKALEMYKEGKQQIPTGHASTELTAAQQEVAAHNASCVEGTGRCYVRTGAVSEGVEVALGSDNVDFINECAKLCEEGRYYADAARLYEKAGDVERAATLYIERGNNLKAAGRLLPQIKSRNIIGLFASAKEKEGSYAEAASAYEQAEDWDNVVRLKVQKLNDLHGAYVIVRNTRSADAAALVAKMCKERGDHGTAVEFLVLAKSTNEAFALAKEKDCMFNYESALLSQTQLSDGVAPLQSQQDFATIADYYEKAGKAGQSALYYHIAGNFPMALKKYMEAGQPEDIEKAVEVVGKARSDALINKLIDYLMGEVDGEPKDPSYIFKLYMALGSYEKAAKTSVIIASKEQEMGNYRASHKTLVDASRILRDRNMRIPNDLRRALMLLHSYIIVKDLVKYMRDEETACRMLMRVSRNVQRFPKHVATIVTSTVLQCLKAGFKKSAFEFARFLIQNETYRAELNEKNKKKIEGVVRRRGKDDMEDPVEAASLCPFCDAPVPETELDCGACKNTLPFCIVTGKHVVKSDYVVAPCCGFPAVYSALVTRLHEAATCPMCEATLDVNKLQRQLDPDVKAYL